MFKPARAASYKAQDNDEVLCDLDAILSHRVTIKYQDKVHALATISTQVFFEFYASVTEFTKQDHQDPDSINQAYFKIISSVCPTFSYEEVCSMTVVQKASLFNHLVRKVIGQQAGEGQDDEKKNPLKPTLPLSDSA